MKHVGQHFVCLFVFGVVVFPGISAVTDLTFPANSLLSESTVLHYLEVFNRVNSKMI